MSSVPPPAYVHPGPPPEPPEYPEGLPPLKTGADLWKPWTAWLAIVLGLAVPLVLGIFAGVIIAATGGDIEDKLPAGVTIALTFAQDAGFILAPILVAGWLATRARRLDFGIRKADRPWVAVAILAGVYVAFIVFSAVWVSALGIKDKDTLPQELGVEDSTLNLVLVLVLVTVVAPIAEEFLFRGYIYRALSNWRGVWPAAIISGVIFGGIHLGSSPVGFVVPLMALGVGLALLYHWTGSLFLPVALHAFNNSIAFGATQDDWAWRYALSIPGAVIVSLLGLWLIGRALGDRPGCAAVVSAP